MRGAGFFIAVMVVTVATGGCCVGTDIASWPFDPDTHSIAALHLTNPVALVPGTFMAGVAKVDVTPPVGVPLAGFGGFPRRQPLPDLSPFNYHTLLRPSVGVKDPLFAKALVLSDGVTTVALVTLDAIATDRDIVQSVYDRAVNQGLTVALDNVLVCSSHTHSGPGAMSARWLWQFVAADFFVEPLARQFAQKIANALVLACEDLEPARFGSGIGELTGITHNRRADQSPLLEPTSIDPEMGVIRIDRSDGTPLAVVWNFAIHGTAWQGDNLEYSADMMGAASDYVEQKLGCIALFANGPEGDIIPIHHDDAERMAADAAIMGDKIVGIYQSLETTSDVLLRNHSETVDFGPTHTAVPLDSIWLESAFRFQAIRLNDTVIASVPGEPIMELGRQIKHDGYELGFEQVFVFTLANGHMAYITTEAEYTCGGYESDATLWGPTTAQQVRTACQRQMAAVRSDPPGLTARD